MSSSRRNGVAAGSPRARLPLLDRLMDDDGDGDDVSGAPPSAGVALDALRIAVHRSLEALLNARRHRMPIPATLAELRKSLFTFGIPDPAAGTYNLTAQREAVAKDVEATLRRFEPRLTHIRVQLADEGTEEWGRMRLKVEAVLHVDPVVEAVSYETTLEPVSRLVTVREGIPR